MELKLKAGLEDQLIYLPFEKRNVIGKFIDKSLYPHMYKKYPNLFNIEEPKKTKLVIDDKLISNSISGSDSNIEGKIA